MPEIRVGDRCVVTHDMGSAFRVGDPLLVEEISPDPSRPEYKYLVLSERDQNRYRLSDADLTLATPAMPEPLATQRVSRSDARKQKEPKKSGTTAKVLLVILLLIVFAGGGFLAGRLTYKPKTVVKTVVVRVPTTRTTTPQSQTPSSTPGQSQTSQPSSSQPTGPPFGTVKVSSTLYDEIQPGSTIDVVTAKLGGPGKIASQSGNQTEYAWDGETPGSYITCTFQGGQLVSKNKVGM